MDTKEKAIALAIQEVEEKNFGVTQQYLEVMEVEYENNSPKIAYVNATTPGTVIVYFSVKDQRFFLEIHVITSDSPCVESVWIEDFNEIYFMATSDTLSSQEMSSYTKLTPFEQGDRGDTRKNGAGKHTFTKISFIASKTPGMFNSKIKELLDYLESDAEGIKKLAENADASIVGHIHVYIGNTMIGGPNLDAEDIKRMSKLNLGIWFDQYVCGVQIKD